MGVYVIEALAALAVPAVAWANGSNDNNDNFKDVATLFGSSVSRYRTALILGCGATFLGALASFFISRGLLATFSGAGLVPDSVVHDPAFPLAVALAGSLTVFLATRLGLPVSTTHALIGDRREHHGLYSCGAGSQTQAQTDGGACCA